MSLVVDMATLATGVTSIIYLNDRPDTPDDLLVFSNSGGFDTMHNLGGGVSNYAAERPTFQILIRNSSSATAITWAESLKGIYNGLTATTINSNLYISVFMIGDINSLGKDDRGRSMFSLNFEVKVKR